MNEIQESVIKRITYRVMSDNGYHVRFSLWVNGAIICKPGGLVLLPGEFKEFIDRLGAISDSEWYKKEYGSEEENST